MMTIRILVLAVATTMLASINISYGQDAPQAMPSVSIPTVSTPADASPVQIQPAAPVATYSASPYASATPVNSGGCASCGTSIPQGCHCGGAWAPTTVQRSGGLFAGLHGKGPIGEGCAMGAGCSSYAQQRTFIWGGCNQFFNPGYKCGGGLFGGRNCIVPPQGQGGIGSNDTCSYGSYINR